MSDRIRLVCFDLGGVILRICRSWVEGCEAAEIDVRGDVDGLLAERPWNEINDAYQCGQIDGATFAARFSAVIDGIYSPEEIMLVHDAWTREEYAGVDSVIEAIHAAGVETAVLSNTNHDHWVTFDRYPTVGLVQKRYASHLLEARKPEPAAYRAVEAATGHDAAGILFFDDLEVNVEAARAVGWRAEQIDPLRGTAPQIRQALRAHGVLAPA